jgi:hypothetical protein
MRDYMEGALQAAFLAMVRLNGRYCLLCDDPSHVDVHDGPLGSMRRAGQSSAGLEGRDELCTRACVGAVVVDSRIIRTMTASQSVEGSRYGQSLTYSSGHCQSASKFGQKSQSLANSVSECDILFVLSC